MSPLDDNPPVNLQLMQAAAIALSDADGDYKIAAQILRNLSAADGILRDAIFAHGLGSAVRAAAHDERQKIKAEIIAGASARAKESLDKREVAAAMRAVASATYRGAYSLTLPGGVKLGAATFAQVDAAKRHFEMQLRGVMRSFVFYAAIMERCNGDFSAKISDLWSEKELDDRLREIHQSQVGAL